MEKQIFNVISNNKLFKNIPHESIDQKELFGELLTVKEGKVLYRENSKSDFVYLIISGEINLIKKNNEGEKVSEILRDEDYFGNNNLDGIRNETAIALRDCYLVKIKPSVYNYIRSLDNSIDNKDSAEPENDLLEFNPEKIIDTYESSDYQPDESFGTTKDLAENDLFENDFTESEVEEVPFHENVLDDIKIDEDILLEEFEKLHIKEDTPDELDDLKEKYELLEPLPLPTEETKDVELVEETDFSENINSESEVTSTDKDNLFNKLNLLIENKFKLPILTSKRYVDHLMNKELDEDIEKIVRLLADQMKLLANNLFYYSHFSGNNILRTTRIELNLLLNDIYNELKIDNSCINTEINFELDKEVIINGDKFVLKNVFKEILFNAAKYKPDSSAVLVKSNINGNRIEITFSNNTDKQKEDFANIFSPFNSVKDSSGLGLYYAKNFIELHKGYITYFVDTNNCFNLVINLPIHSMP